MAKKNILKKDLKKAGKELKTASKKIVNKMSPSLENVKSSFSHTGPFKPDKKGLTLGQKTSDALTKWAGSWTFIILFLLTLIVWMALNSYYFLQLGLDKPFDPFPYILLNLVLSTLAAIQAPIILMSQNRAAERDRQRADYDYLVNRKAEREIQDLKKQMNRIERKM
jgi:uncharacterized membrane protein